MDTGQFKWVNRRDIYIDTSPTSRILDQTDLKHASDRVLKLGGGVGWGWVEESGSQGVEYWTSAAS